MKKLYFYFLITISFLCKAQKHDYNWIFDDSVGIDFNTPGFPYPYLAPTFSSVGHENCAVISDKNGVLQFYIGCEGYNYQFSNVYNQYNLPMENGDSLFSHSSTTQGLLIIPSITDTNQYYIVYINTTGDPNYTDGIYYAKVDMSFNNGAGKVITKGNLLYAGLLVEKLTAIKHGNGRDWWIFTHDYKTNAFNRILLSPFGFSPVSKQYIGTVYDTINYFGGAGQMLFSTKGKYLVAAGSASNGFGLINVFNFNRCTGLLSNFKNLNTWISNPNFFGYYGASFSLDESKLYVSDMTFSPSSSKLFQYNLDAPNISTSKTLLLTTQTNYIIGHHLLGPDGKIYIVTTFESAPSNIFSNYNMNLTVINNPDSTGINCNVNPYSFYLGGSRAKIGLPNMINYRLYREADSPCDTLFANNLSVKELSIIDIYPNPVNTNFIVSTPNNKFHTIMLYDYTYKKIMEQSFINSTSIDLTKLESGIYFYDISINREIVKKGKVIKN